MLQLGRKLLRKIKREPERQSEDIRPVIDIWTVCRPVSEEVEVRTRILDASVGGVKMLVPRSMREGTMVRIDLPQVAGPVTTILACVMHAHEHARGEWEVGCNFSLELSDEEMQALGAEKTLAEAGDLRAWVRHPARGIVEIRVLPGDDGSPLMAQLVNLSPAGVGLVTDEKLEPGAALSVRLKRLDDKPDRSLLACVVYQTERPDGKWAVGCNFLHELTEPELDELLWTSTF